MDRALLVGIDAYPDNGLSGCVNDINDMRDFLIDKCGFSMESICPLPDQDAKTSAILDKLGWMLAGLREGDRVLFHYSGHGVQLVSRDSEGNVNRLYEVICPVDFDWTFDSAITDEQFNAMFSSVPAGVEFVWVSDSCHSGGLLRGMPPTGTGMFSKTILPPADVARELQTAYTQGISAMGLLRAAEGLNVALIAGCKSDQEAKHRDFGGRPNGVLTYFLLQELEKASGLTTPLKDIVAAASLAVTGAVPSQEPQLEGSEVIKLKPFLSK